MKAHSIVLWCVVIGFSLLAYVGALLNNPDATAVGAIVAFVVGFFGGIDHVVRNS